MSSNNDKMISKCIEWSSKQTTDPHSQNFNASLAIYKEEETDSNFAVDPFDNFACLESYLAGKKNTNTEPARSNKHKSFNKNKAKERILLNRDISNLKNGLRKKYKSDQEAGIKRCSSARRFQNVFSSMVDLCNGPMEVLQTARSKNQLCCIYTRHICGLKSMIVGNVQMFDRYMNIVLKNAHEVFSQTPIGKVKDHQKGLSISSLDEAFRKTKAYEELKKNARIKDEKSSENPAKSLFGIKKPKDCGNLKFPQLVKFKGGFPRLFYRRLDCVYVRGDTICIVRLFDHL